MLRSLFCVLLIEVILKSEGVSVGSKCNPIQNFFTAPGPGRKAREKCAEYQDKYVFPCEVGNVRGNNCKHDASMDVDGTNATEGEFSHMAMIGDKSSMFFPCGGSVVSDRFVLTSASCVSSRELQPPNFVLVGTLKRAPHQEYDEDNLYGIQRIFMYPEFTPPSMYHDLALLQTERPIRLSPSVVPACLDTGEQDIEEVIGTGWGATYKKGPMADTLQKIKLSRFAQEDCSIVFSPNRLLRHGIANTHICYGPTEEARDMCLGNSGCPVQVKTLDCMYSVVGVTSFGKGCGVVGMPGVYTRVAEYVSWIESVVWP